MLNGYDESVKTCNNNTMKNDTPNGIITLNKNKSDGNYYNIQQSSKMQGSNPPVQQATSTMPWSYSHYLTSFYNCYPNNQAMYNLHGISQNQTQVVDQRSHHNFNHHTNQSDSLVECCDPRCHWLSENPNYSTSSSSKPPQRKKQKLVHNNKDTVVGDDKLRNRLHVSSLQTDLNNRYNQSISTYDHLYQRIIRNSKGPPIDTVPPSFPEFPYQDYGKGAAPYYNGHHPHPHYDWSKNLQSSYYSQNETIKNQKYTPPVNVTGNIDNNKASSSTYDQSILMGRLLEQPPSVKASNFQNSYYPSKSFNENHEYFPNYPKTTHNDTLYNRESTFDYSMHPQSHVAESTFQPTPSIYRDYATKSTTNKNNVSYQKTTKNKNNAKDVREFLSTWDDEEDDKVTNGENGDTVIVLDCKSIENSPTEIPKHPPNNLENIKRTPLPNKLQTYPNESILNNCYSNQIPQINCRLNENSITKLENISHRVPEMAGRRPKDDPFPKTIPNDPKYHPSFVNYSPCQYKNVDERELYLKKRMIEGYSKVGGDVNQPLNDLSESRVVFQNDHNLEKKEIFCNKMSNYSEKSRKMAEQCVIMSNGIKKGGIHHSSSGTTNFNEFGKEDYRSNSYPPVVQNVGGSEFNAYYSQFYPQFKNHSYDPSSYHKETSGTGTGADLTEKKSSCLFTEKGVHPPTTPVKYYENPDLFVRNNSFNNNFEEPINYNGTFQLPSDSKIVINEGFTNVEKHKETFNTEMYHQTFHNNSMKLGIDKPETLNSSLNLPLPVVVPQKTKNDDTLENSQCPIRCEFNMPSLSPNLVHDASSSATSTSTQEIQKEKQQIGEEPMNVSLSLNDIYEDDDEIFPILRNHGESVVTKIRGRSNSLESQGKVEASRMDYEGNNKRGGESLYPHPVAEYVDKQFDGNDQSYEYRNGEVIDNEEFTESLNELLDDQIDEDGQNMSCMSLEPLNLAMHKPPIDCDHEVLHAPSIEVLQPSPIYEDVESVTKIDENYPISLTPSSHQENGLAESHLVENKPLWVDTSSPDLVTKPDDGSREVLAVNKVQDISEDGCTSSIHYRSCTEERKEPILMYYCSKAGEMYHSDVGGYQDNDKELTMENSENYNDLIDYSFKKQESSPENARKRKFNEISDDFIESHSDLNLEKRAKEDGEQKESQLNGNIEEKKPIEEDEDLKTEDQSQKDELRDEIEDKGSVGSLNSPNSINADVSNDEDSALVLCPDAMESPRSSFLQGNDNEKIECEDVSVSEKDDIESCPNQNDEEDAICKNEFSEIAFTPSELIPNRSEDGCNSENVDKLLDSPEEEGLLEESFIEEECIDSKSCSGDVNEVQDLCTQEEGNNQVEDQPVSPSSIDEVCENDEENIDQEFSVSHDSWNLEDNVEIEVESSKSPEMNEDNASIDDSDLNEFEVAEEEYQISDIEQTAIEDDTNEVENEMELKNGEVVQEVENEEINERNRSPVSCGSVDSQSEEKFVDEEESIETFRNKDEYEEVSNDIEEEEVEQDKLVPDEDDTNDDESIETNGEDEDDSCKMTEDEIEESHSSVEEIRDAEFIEDVMGVENDVEGNDYEANDEFNEDTIAFEKEFVDVDTSNEEGEKIEVEECWKIDDSENVFDFTRPPGLDEISTKPIFIMESSKDESESMNKEEEEDKNEEWEGRIRGYSNICGKDHEDKDQDSIWKVDDNLFNDNLIERYNESQEEFSYNEMEIENISSRDDEGDDVEGDAEDKVPSLKSLSINMLSNFENNNQEDYMQYDEEGEEIGDRIEYISNVEGDGGEGSESNEDMDCRCLVISEEERVECLRCSLQSSITLTNDIEDPLSPPNRNNRFSLSPIYSSNESDKSYHHDDVENPGSVQWDEPDLISDDESSSSCTEKEDESSSESSDDEESSSTSSSSDVTSSESEESDCEKIESDERQEEVDFQIKVQLPWDRIFNLNNKDDSNGFDQWRRKELELGPAKIHVMLSSEEDVGMWKVTNSTNKISSIVNVRRLILQRADNSPTSKTTPKFSDDNLNTGLSVGPIISPLVPPTPSCSPFLISPVGSINDLTESTCSNFHITNTYERLNVSSSPVRIYEDDVKFKKLEELKDNSILPKMIIKKTSTMEYKSYLRKDENRQPIVRLLRRKSLDDMAVGLAIERRLENESALKNGKKTQEVTDELSESMVLQDEVMEHNSNVEEEVKNVVVEDKCKEHSSDEDSISITTTTTCSKRELHHCLLCHRSYPNATLHNLHVNGRYHLHMELMQRKTIHALYRHFTGHSCPNLKPLTWKERKDTKWKPRNKNVDHFYYDRTPLQTALRGQPEKE